MIVEPGTSTLRPSCLRYRRRVYDPNPRRGLADDGLYLSTIKRHSLEKIRAHNHNVQMFATATKSRWPQRAYLGLYSGSGRARLEGAGEIVETTATSVFRLPDPFTHYVFVDRDPQCTSALESRVRKLSPEANVTILTGDVNELVPQIRDTLPSYSRGNGLLSYCFVDPFDASLKFSTIRTLGALRMDFLILLMLGYDARVNFKRYLEDEANPRIGDLVDAPNWREEWRRLSAVGRQSVIRFLMTKFDQAMVRIGYRPAPAELAFPVKVHGKNVLIYQLVFYSKHRLGQEFWQKTHKGVARHPDLFR